MNDKIPEDELNSNDNSAEMEEWMNTWTSETEHLSWAREDFVKKMRWQYVNDIATLAVLGIVAVVMAWQLFSHFLPAMFTGVIFFVYCVAAAATVIRRIRAQREALPLSVSEYLSKMRHNLELRQKQLRWEQWTTPPIIVIAIVCLSWLVWSRWDDLLAEPYRLVVVGFVVGVALPYALYSAFQKKPSELLEEERRLDELEGQPDI